MFSGNRTTPPSTKRRQALRGFSLIEVVVAVIIGTFLVVGIANGYSQSARRAEWSAYSLAAQSLAMQRMELARSAKWDNLAYDPTPGRTNSDKLIQVNFPVAVDVLDIPIAGTNITYATSTTTITPDVGGNPLLRMVKVQTIWPFLNGRRYTNTIVTYRAPDQ